MAELPVALDAMGGDNGPAPNVEGAIAAVKEDGARVILVGNEAMLAPLVKGVDGIEIRHAPDVVAMDDKPALAARKKKESSMRIACDLVGDGVACGALSAGNSGAMMAVALLVFGRVDGVMRPAIGTMLPSLGDLGLVHLVDAGANIECEPAHLAQFAVLGNEYVKRTFALEQPRVGVLSNGEEDGKGTELTRASLDLVRKLPLNVHGYVEGRELNTGLVHVIVTDGFTGNVMLKTAEGVFKFVTGQIRDGYERGSLKEKLGALLSQSMFERMRKQLDPREFGAAPLLGLAKPAFIAHGSSDAYSIRRGIGAVRSYARADLVKHMTAAIAQAAPLLEQKKPA